MIDDLLMLADELAGRDTGRPRQASLRRAVATAYYAVFHALAKMCADQLIGPSKSWEVYTPVYRALDHGAARRVLQEARIGQARDADVARIGMIFIDLAAKRIEADYVPEPFKFSRGEVKDSIRQARGAVSMIDALPPETKLRLAVRFVTKSR